MAGSADEPDACANSMCFPLGEDGVAGDVAVSARAAPANHSTPNEKMIARANALEGLMDPLGFAASLPNRQTQASKFASRMPG